MVKVSSWPLFSFLFCPQSVLSLLSIDLELPALHLVNCLLHMVKLSMNRVVRDSDHEAMSQGGDLKQQSLELLEGSTFSSIPTEG